MPNVTIYHNPRCSKSRETMELLFEKNIEPVIVEYLKSPPTAKEIKQLLSLLGMSARDLIRQNEAVYQEKQLDNPSLSETELIRAMVSHPVLIERPIVIVNDKAVIGRPPENILELI
jgi:arsenate reductase (glutaredoxin)